MSRSQARTGPTVRAAGAGAVVIFVAALSVCANANWHAPPRFDGAGYAVLAQAWIRGQGYRAIDHPDQPLHAHFPPGYPLALALLWTAVGPSATAAHALSALLTVGAALAAWCWYRTIMPPAVAFVAALALGVNWQWARAGSAILSEPLFMLLSQLTILAFLKANRRSTLSAVWLLALGAVLAACLLTRHVAIGLWLAVVLDLAWRKRARRAAAVVGFAVLLVSPWIAWMAMTGSDGGTQPALLAQSDQGVLQRLAPQAIFYTQRIPDQICGPLVEVGAGSGRFSLVANTWAIVGTIFILAGWAHALARPARRLPALVALCTLAILVVWPFTEAGRFLIPLVPNLILGLIDGITALARRIHFPGWTAPRQARSRIVAAALVLAISVPYSAYAIATRRARAAESLHRDFDAACQWIATHAQRPGPVLSRHPGEVFWQTGRQSLAIPARPSGATPDQTAAAIDQLIQKYRIPYILVDEDRYANAPASPLGEFASSHPARLRTVWEQATPRGSITIHEVDPPR